MSRRPFSKPILCKGGEKWHTQCRPRTFPTAKPRRSHAVFFWGEVLLQEKGRDRGEGVGAREGCKSVHQVTSQDESCMTHICIYQLNDQLISFHCQKLAIQNETLVQLYTLDDCVSIFVVSEVYMHCI